MYHHGWLCGVVPPRSTYTLNVIMKEQKEPPPANFLIIRSTVISEEKIIEIGKKESDIGIVNSNFFNMVERGGIDKVHELKLNAVCDPQGETAAEIVSMPKDKKVLSMDVHPTEPWIIRSHSEGNFSIWNYEEMKNMVQNVTREHEDMSFWTSKFIARKQWIVAGNGRGYIHVYNYNTMEKVMSWQTHTERITCVAIHPTEPYVLSVSHDYDIWMWDWDKGDSAQIFKGHNGSVYQIAFNPKNSNTFATVSEDKKVKIWTIGSPDPITMRGHEVKIRCLDYFTRVDGQYLITGSDDGVAKIWDLQKTSCVKTLKGHTKRVSTVCSQPTLPLLMTGSFDGTVRLWDSDSFRLKGIINFGLKEVYALGHIMEGTRRCKVLIEHRYGLAILPHEEVARSSENTM